MPLKKPRLGFEWQSHHWVFLAGQIWGKYSELAGSLHSKSMENALTVANILAGAGGGVVVPLANKIFGPAADEIGLIMSDRIRVFRLQKQIKLFARTQEMLAAAGVDAKQVNLKVLLPLMEHASLEEDPELSEKWAALLANAADATNRVEVKPIFGEILKQMTPGEARLLNHFYKAMGLEYNMALSWLISKDEIRESYSNAYPHLSADFNYCLDALMHNTLITGGTAATYGPTRSDNVLFFTTLGLDFVRACTAPKSASPSA